MYVLPGEHMDFKDFPQGPAIASGVDRTTPVNDENIRIMPIFDAVIGNGDRHGGNHMVSLDVSRDAMPLRWRHWLVDNSFGFDGAGTPAALSEAVAKAGGSVTYAAVNRQSLLRGCDMLSLYGQTSSYRFAGIWCYSGVKTSRRCWPRCLKVFCRIFTWSVFGNGSR